MMSYIFKKSMPFYAFSTHSICLFILAFPHTWRCYILLMKVYKLNYTAVYCVFNTNFQQGFSPTTDFFIKKKQRIEKRVVCK